MSDPSATNATHYVCQGECGGTAEKPAVCHAEDCSQHQQAMAGCTCTTGDHQQTPATPAVHPQA